MTANAGACALALAAWFVAQPASAITAEDVMKKMSKDERFGYLTGLIDMLAYQMAAAGNGPLSACIYNTFYRDQSNQAFERLYSAFDQFPDKSPEIIVTLLAKKVCDK